MASKVTSFFKGMLEGFRPTSDTTPTVLGERLTNNNSEMTELYIYGGALYDELKYRQHVKQLEDLEVEYDRRYRRLQESAYKRNMHVSISKLPVEILSRVFHCMRLPPPIDEIFSEMYPFIQKTTDWAVVTWVCRHWRTVALNDAALWIHVPQYSATWTVAMLKRSRNAGLNVDFESCGRCDKSFSAILLHRSHIARLRLKYSTLEYLLSKHHSLFSMPMLQKLWISKSSLSLRDNTRPRLPNNIFVDSVNLRYLEVSGIDIDWNSQLLSNSLRDLRLFQSSSPTSKDLKSAIRRMTSLDFLYLRRTLSGSQDVASPRNGRRITAKSLRGLDLDEDPAAIIWFFNNVSLALEHQHVQIVARLPSESRKILLNLLAALRRPMAIGRLLSISQSVAISVDYKLHSTDGTGLTSLVLNAMNLLASTITEESSLEDKRDVILYFAQKHPTHFPQDIRHNAFHPMFTDIFNHFGWSCLRELTLLKLSDIVSPLTFGTTLAQTFGTLPKLRLIRVGRTCAKPLVDALLIGSSSGARRNGKKKRCAQPLAFPGLEEIHMERVSFESVPEYGKEAAVDAERFVDCLASRVLGDVPVQVLEFCSCPGLTSGHLDTFRELVDDVWWDEEGSEFSSEFNNDNGHSSSYDDDDDDENRNEDEDSTRQEDNCEDVHDDTDGLASDNSGSSSQLDVKVVVNR